MDSMRSLNKSLPTSQPIRSAPPEQISQLFKQAALSVTSLYKSAINDAEASRQAGYQDALKDLLEFLDAESLGLQDGEGWRVRQWATQRYDVHLHSDGEEDPLPAETRQSSISSSLRRSTEPQCPSSPKSEPYNDTTRKIDTTPEPVERRPPAFQLSAGAALQGDSDMQTDENQNLQRSEEAAAAASSSSSSSSTPAVRVELLEHPSRSSARHSTNRHNTKSAQRETPSGSNSKRRFPFPDISDIFNVGFDKKDSSGGSGSNSKRVRFT